MRQKEREGESETFDFNLFFNGQIFFNISQKSSKQSTHIHITIRTKIHTQIRTFTVKDSLSEV